MNAVSHSAGYWSGANPILGKGQEGTESDTGKSKIGDGLSTWAALDYVGGGGLAVGESYILASNSELSIIPSGSGVVVWDETTSDNGHTPYSGILPNFNLLGLSAGVYVVDLEIDLATPLPALCSITAVMSAMGADGTPNQYASVGPSLIGDLVEGAYLNLHGTLVVPEDPSEVSLKVFMKNANPSGSTDPANTVPFIVVYVYANITKIG